MNEQEYKAAPGLGRRLAGSEAATQRPGGQVNETGAGQQVTPQTAAPGQRTATQPAGPALSFPARGSAPSAASRDWPSEGLLAFRRARLEERLLALRPLAVAVSGGVDSMTLAWLAHCLAPGTRLFHALSPAVPAAATARVLAHAKRWGWNLAVIHAGEMDDPHYRANPLRRCYHCKSNLYAAIRRQGSFNIAAGTNRDDLSDFRPGLQAAAEQGVFHPYVEAGFDKALVRALAAQAGLDDLKDLPASPCLASRVSTGMPIDPGLLLLVDAAECALRELLADLPAVRALRCRVQPGGLAVQLDGGLELAAPRAAAMRALLRGIFVPGPFAALAADIALEPYRQGSAFLQPGAPHA